MTKSLWSRNFVDEAAAPAALIFSHSVLGGVATVEFLPETQISHLIACKKYEEKITSMLMCKAYDDIFGRERESNQQQVHKSKRILLVDDEYDINFVMKAVLEESGFKVDSFTDASGALSYFSAGVYDLVILDVIMPEMDGFSLCEKIKKLDDKVTICF